MADLDNWQWRLAKRPHAGELVGRQHFRFSKGALPDLGPGDILIKTICLGTSPAQRSYIAAGKSMHQKVQIGEVMHGRGVGEVIESLHPDFHAGDIIAGGLGWQNFSALSAEPAAGKESLFKIREGLRPLTLALGILGQAGYTAYFGLQEIGGVRAGQTVLISSAAGGVGSVAGQIAKILGCRTIGLTGSAQKCRWLVEDLGFEAAINYKTQDLGEALSKLCPEGIDVFFDNVGGAILNITLQHLAPKARVVISGWISTFDDPRKITGPSNYTELLRKRARMEGLFVFDYVDKFDAAYQDLHDWYAQGLLKNTEDVDHGLDKMPDALASLFTGANKGIKIVRVAPEPDQYNDS